MFDKRGPYFNRALLCASTGEVLCRIQSLGASFLITCPAAPVSNVFDYDIAIETIATPNMLQCRSQPPDFPPPSAAPLSELLQARNRAKSAD